MGVRLEMIWLSKVKIIFHMIAPNFDKAFENVGKLVANFQKHEKDYLASDYKEDRVRKDFIDKFGAPAGSISGVALGLGYALLRHT